MEAMTDIVERLRQWKMWPETSTAASEDIYELTQEAAAEIERLRELTANVPNLVAEIERLRAAHQYTLDEYEAYCGHAKAEIVRLRERCAALERAVDYEAGEPGTVEYHKALFDRLHAAEAKLKEKQHEPG